jgi:hypothetical protein
MPDVSFLAVLLFVVVGFLVVRRRKRPPVMQCRACRLEMVHDGDLPDVFEFIPDITRGLAPPPTRTAMFHCPGCGRRAGVAS